MLIIPGWHYFQLLQHTLLRNKNIIHKYICIQTHTYLCIYIISKSINLDIIHIQVRYLNGHNTSNSNKILALFIFIVVTPFSGSEKTGAHHFQSVLLIEEEQRQRTDKPEKRMNLKNSTEDFKVCHSTQLSSFLNYTAFSMLPLSTCVT